VKVLRNEPVPVIVNGKPLKQNGKQVMKRPYTPEQQFMACDRPMDRALGKAPVVAQVDQTSREMSTRRIEVRWMPPDPADRSRYIPPEPD
jgi:hypothetical protein